MMTPHEQLDFFAERASSGLAHARIKAAEGDWYALFNWSSAATSHFMRGLIGWRTGLLDPQADLRGAIEASEAAIAFMRGVDVGVARFKFNPHPGAYSAILLDRVDSPAVSEMGRALEASAPPAVTKDVKADAWLMSALAGRQSGDGPLIAAKLAAAKRTALWGETLADYFELLSVDPSDASEAWARTEGLVRPFIRRKRNGYLGGSWDYLGGGLYNGITVDFHLAAIWRVRGWDAIGLSSESRVHALLPASSGAVR